MTFTVIDSISRYSIDIESLDELYALGHERYPETPMVIDWEIMTITFE